MPHLLIHQTLTFIRIRDGIAVTRPILGDGNIGVVHNTSKR